MVEDTQFVLGNHSARLEGVEKRLIELQVSQKDQTAKLDQLLARDNRVKGGFAVVFGASAFAGTIATLIVEYFKK